jgi:high-affinity Fe2+/Pb2+ permease
MVRVDAIRAEMRLLNAEADAVPGISLTNWSNPEFWTMVVSAVTNLVTVAVVLGWLSSTDAETVTKALSALIGAGQVIIVNGLLVWRFISARVQVKQAMITARYNYMAAVTTEQMRLSMRTER